MVEKTSTVSSTKKRTLVNEEVETSGFSIRCATFTGNISSQTLSLAHKISPVDGFSWTNVGDKSPVLLMTEFGLNRKSYKPIDILQNDSFVRIECIRFKERTNEILLSGFSVTYLNSIH